VDYDVIVVGAGLAGAAAAWQLTRRGRSVLVLEAHPLGHRRGSSHGTSRIYRRAYADPFYVQLTGRAEAAWQELESEAHLTLRTPTGGVDSGQGRDLAQMVGMMIEQGVPAELVSAAAAAERWPGMLFDGPVMFHPGAGFLNPNATVNTCLQLARGGGAVVWAETAVVSLEMAAGGVAVHTAGGSQSAAQVVVAAGPWLRELLPNLGIEIALAPLGVRQTEVFHFRHRDPGAAWPTVVHKGEVELYGLPSGADGGPAPAMKIGQFDDQTFTSATKRDQMIDPRARQVVRGHVDRWLPGLEPDPVNEQSCLFTMTPDQDFILDRTDPVVIASPCSGHGAKFTPLIGALIADLVEGAPPLPRFAFR